MLPLSSSAAAAAIPAGAGTGSAGVNASGAYCGSRLRKSEDPAVWTAAQELTQELDFSLRGASVILGLRKPIFKAHGSATERTIPNAVRRMLRFLEADYPAHWAEVMQRGS